MSHDVAKETEFGVPGMPAEVEDSIFLLALAESGNPAPLPKVLAHPAMVHRDAAAQVVAGAGLKGVTSRDMIGRLVRGGFLEEVKNAKGDVIALAFSRRTADGIVQCARGGCTDEEIDKAPAWIRDRVRGTP